MTFGDREGQDLGWASTGSGWQDRLIAGLRMLSLERPASNFRPWLVSGSLDFILGAFPPLPDKSGSLCLNCLYKQHGVCHTPAFLPEALNFCLHQAERAYVSSLNKNLGHRVSHEVPWWTAFPTCCLKSLAEELNAPCGTPWEDSWKLAPGCLAPFPFAAFALYRFTVTKHIVNMTIFWVWVLLATIKPGVVLRNPF